MKAEPSISARRTVFTSFAVDVFDIVLNGIAALVTGSVVMLVETLQGFADVIADIFLIIGLQRSKRPRDKRHPFGHGRELYVWTLFSGVVMFVLVAGISLYSGWQRFLNPDPIEYIGIAYGVLIFSIITNGYAFSVSFRRLIGNNTRAIRRTFIHSPLIETKTTFVFDLMGIFAAIFGFIALILYSITGNMRFDGLGAMVIGGVMVVLAILLMVGTKDLLVGKRVSQEVENRIRESALSIPEVQEVLDLRTNHLGLNRILVNIEVHLKENLHTEQIERIIDQIKKVIMKDTPSVYHIQVELETPDDSAVS